MLPLLHRSLNRRNTDNPYTHLPSQSEPLTQQAEEIQDFSVRSHHGHIPIGASCILLLAVLFSFLFMSIITLAYIGADNSDYFQRTLDDITRLNFGSGVSRTFL